MRLLKSFIVTFVVSISAAGLLSVPVAPLLAKEPPALLPAPGGDTIPVLRFRVPPGPLPDALRELGRLATMRVEVDLAAAADLQSAGLDGTFTAAAALRQLLAGTGLALRFADSETAIVTRGGADDAPLFVLTPLTVIGERSRGYGASRTTSATRTETPLRDAPQSVTLVTRELIADQAMSSMADVVRYVPGVTMGQGEGHRDAPTIRGNSSTADFFVDGVRDDAQYLRDLYNVERVEALKGPNAMIFGRGGGGGVLNRVSKEAQWAPTLVLTGEAGSFDHRRITMDFGQGLSADLAARVLGVYENSGGFRDRFERRREGINPTLALALGSRTIVRGGYEYFDDERTVDRGVPSFQGRPTNGDITEFFGNPDVSRSAVDVHAATASLEYASRGGLSVRSRVRFADYDKFYQNSFPGAVSAAGTEVTLTAYNQTIGRRNLISQTDVVYGVATGPVRHTLLIGFEVARQETDNHRETGYYDDAATSVLAPFDQPTISTPVTFRQSATDADNHSEASVLGAWVQDQLALSRHVHAIVGLRLERFGVDFHNNRTNQDLVRNDDMVSPRAGLVLKPVEAASIYGSYGISHLPSSGDQFSSLTVTTETLEPERFENVEVGAKWDVLPNVSVTAAAYRLDRTNTSAPDPNDPARTVQTGSQRTTGFEVGGSGSMTPRWQIMAGFASQKAEIVSRTAAAQPGTVVPLVPERTASLWNRYQVTPSLGVGFGVVHQADMFAAIDNSVTLPGFTRVDAAAFVRIGELLSAQVNVENLLDERYYPTSHGNNNIMPGATRNVRISLTTRR
jgi:catecholate siderophore receptor